MSTGKSTRVEEFNIKLARTLPLIVEMRQYGDKWAVLLLTMISFVFILYESAIENVLDADSPSK